MVYHHLPRHGITMPAVSFCKDKATHAMNKRCATLFYPLRNTVARYFDLPAMRSTAGQVMQKTTTYTAYYFSHHAAPRPNNAATIHNVYMASKKILCTQRSSQSIRHIRFCLPVSFTGSFIGIQNRPQVVDDLGHPAVVSVPLHAAV